MLSVRSFSSSCAAFVLPPIGRHLFITHFRRSVPSYYSASNQILAGNQAQLFFNRSVVCRVSPFCSHA